MVRQSFKGSFRTDNKYLCQFVLGRKFIKYRHKGVYKKVFSKESTLCFIFRVPLARKSITFICRQALLIAGCQIEGMTTSKNCTQGFFPMIHQSGIVCTLLALLKKWNRVLDWYEKMQICSFSKNDILQLIFIFLLELSWFNILVCVYNLRMPGWNTGKRHNLYFYL